MDVQEILNKCTVEGKTLKLPAGTLDFKLYRELKKHLEQLGGKWNGGRIQGFVFEQDPSHLVGKTKDVSVQADIFSSAPAVSNESSETETEAEEINEVQQTHTSNYKKGGAIERAIQRMEEAELKNNAEQKCRICGCTDSDCRKCIKLTGKPCHWVEDDLCSACADAIKTDQSRKNDDDMNFFQQLQAVGQVDLTMRIMEKNGKLTLMIMPGATSSVIPPINITGTPAEIDEKFFSVIAPGVTAITGMVSNIEDVKKEIADKKDIVEVPVRNNQPDGAKKLVHKSKAKKGSMGRLVEKKSKAVPTGKEPTNEESEPASEEA